MLFNAEIYRQLHAFAGLEALVGTRISPHGHGLQGGTLPYVTYQRLSTERTYLHDQSAAISKETVQVDCYAGDPDEARQVAVQVQQALDAWSSPEVNRAFIRDDEDFYERDTKLYRVRVEAEVWTTLTAV